MELANNHTLGSIDNERTLRSHHGNFTHENDLLLYGIVVIQKESDIQRNTES